MSSLSRFSFQTLAATALLALPACSIQASGSDEELDDRVRDLERRVQRLESPSRYTPTSGSLSDQRARLQAELRDLRRLYTDRHPDVQAVLAQLAEVERQLAADAAD
ncbi:MAG TPA: hypothetical protein VGC54_14170 [Planctomycetota bacterium]